MRRIRYATGTVDPRDEGVAVPETGLGSLIPRLAEQAYGTTNNTTLGNRMYGGLYAEDPTEEELASGFLDISQAEGTPTYGIPDFDRYSYASRDFRSLPSLYELYLSGGLDNYVAGVDPSTGTVDTPVDTGGDGAEIPGAMDSLVTPNVDQGVVVDQNFADVVDTGGEAIYQDPIMTMGDTAPVDNMSFLADEEFARQNTGTEDYLQGITDEELYGTPETTVTNVGNPFGYEDPQSLAIGPEGAVDFNTGGLEDYMPERTLTSAPVNQLGTVDQAPPGGGGDDYFDMNLLDETANIGPVKQLGTVDQAPPGIMNPYQPTLEELAAESNLDITSGFPTYDRVPATQLGDEANISDYFDMNLLDETANIGPVDEPEYSVTRPAGIDAPMINPQLAPQTTFGDPVDVEQGFTQDLNISEAASDDLEADPGTQPVELDTPPNFINEAGQSIANYLGTAYDAINQSVVLPTIGKVNLATTAAKFLINKLAGGPVTLLIDALSQLPSSNPYTAEVLTDKYGITEDGKIAGNPADNVFAGMNAVSMFGDPIQGAQDRVDTIQNTYDNYDNQWSNLKETDPDKFYEQKQNIKNKLDSFTEQLNEVENKLGDVTGDQEGMTIAEDLAQKTRTEYRDDMADITTGDASEAEKIAARDREIEQAENISDISGEDIEELDSTSNTGSNDRPSGGFTPPNIHQDSSPAPAPAPSPAPSYSPPSPHGNGGGNQGGSSGSPGKGSGSSGPPGRGYGGFGGPHFNKGGIVSLKNGKR